MKLPKWEIDQNSPLPYYYQVSQVLLREIEKGELQHGMQLPSEGDVSRFYGVSLSVVRQAFKMLENKGVILRKKGKKAVVAREPKIQLEFIGNQASHYAELVSKGMRVTTAILKNQVETPPEDIRTALDFKESEQVVALSRLRSVERRPVIYWTSYLPSGLFPGLENIDLTDRSLYDTLSEQYNVKPFSSERSFEVVLADKSVGSLLRINAGEPAIYIEWTSYMKNGRAIEYYRGWHTVNNWKFTFHSKIGES
jgi:GntR family transcriptional regulator